MHEVMLRRLVLLGLCCVIVEGEAQALSCAGPPYGWYSNRSFQLREAPVDVRPWITYSCYYTTPEQEFGACSLVAADHEVSVGFELVVAGCDRETILEFVPGEALLPGRRYSLECEHEDPYEASWVETRAASAPASPAQEVVIASTLYVQGDETCCGTDSLEVELADADPAFLREGGRIEVHVGGELVTAVDHARASELVLPPILDDIEFTSIAADGTRGPTTRLLKREIRRQPVYIPCAVTSGSPSLALWLTLPLLWIHAHGRRRRRST